MQKKTIWDLGRATLEEYRARPKLPLVVILDNIRSLNNIGAIFRTSDAFLVKEIALCGITATPPSPEIHKTALGAEDSVAWHYYNSTAEAVIDLHRRGYTVCALEQVKESIELQNFQIEPTKKYAIIAGHEVHGVDPEVVNMCDCCIEIPQFGTKHSLNVSVSTGIALWHFFSHLTAVPPTTI
ncbi:MAG: RNA methyltransferase [Paramuribaculum sp.]|nr:RNA methyltransferase [Paramuribaculum sp.]